MHEEKIFKTSTILGGITITTKRITDTDPPSPGGLYARGMVTYQNVVEIPWQQTIETYSYGSLDEAMQGHDFLSDTDGIYSTDHYKPDPADRFRNIGYDIEEEDAK